MKETTIPDLGANQIVFNHKSKLVQALSHFARAIWGYPALAGFKPRALVVGGFVRDTLLGLDPKDADVEVYGVTPPELITFLDGLFPGKVDKVGQQFGVLKVCVAPGIDFDVSIPRRESKVGKGHTGFITQSDPTMSIQEAARRRDFTWNALAADILTGEIFDFYGGIEDLQQRCLRVTDSQRFQDDPLRVWRAVQFAARLEFAVEAESFALMADMVKRGLLDELPAERVSGEMEKLLLKARRPSLGLELARNLGIIEKYFPELHALVGTPQDSEWHPEGDVWVHTMMVVDRAADIIRQVDRGFTDSEKLQVMVGALCHDLGKPATTELIDGRIRSRGHEEAGKELARQFCAKLRLGEAVTAAAINIAGEHLKPGQNYRLLVEKMSITPQVYVNIIRRLLKRIHPTSWRVLIAGSESDFRGRTLSFVDSAEYGPGLLMKKMVLEYGLEVAATQSLIGGKDIIAMATEMSIQIKPGKVFGQYINAIETLRDECSISTREEALAVLRTYLERDYKK